METPPKDARILMALQAIRQDQKLSIRRAAAIYNVSYTTLLRRQNGTPSRRDSPLNSRKLTSSEEMAIVEYILDLDSRFFSPRIRYVEDMANILLAERGSGRVGTNWTANFIKRQPDLQTRRFRRYDY
jgi:hypothetical protein